MEPTLCSTCKKPILKKIGSAVAPCVCGAVMFFLVGESVMLPLEDVGALGRTYRDRGQVVLRLDEAIPTEQFHIDATSSGEWIQQQTIQVATTSTVFLSRSFSVPVEWNGSSSS